MSVLQCTFTHSGHLDVFLTCQKLWSVIQRSCAVKAMQSKLSWQRDASQQKTLKPGRSSSGNSICTSLTTPPLVSGTVSNCTVYAHFCCHYLPFSTLHSLADTLPEGDLLCSMSASGADELFVSSFHQWGGDNETWQARVQHSGKAIALNQKDC